MCKKAKRIKSIRYGDNIYSSASELAPQYEGIAADPLR